MANPGETPRIDTLESRPGHNYCINGSFDFWQRGTSFINSTNTFIADRWFAYGNSVDWTRVSETINGADRFAVRFRGNGNHGLTTTLETYDTKYLHNKFVTVSFYAKVGSTFTGTVRAHLGRNTSEARSPQNDTYGFRDITSELSTSWQRITITNNQVVGTDAAAFIFSVDRTPSTTDNDDFVQIAQVQIEEGQSVTAWNRHGNSYADELVACQRYFEKSYDIESPIPSITNNGAYVFRSDSTNTHRGFSSFAVSKRTGPAITLYAPHSGASGNWTSEDGGNVNVGASVHSAGQRGFTAEATPSGGSTILLGHWTADAEL